MSESEEAGEGWGFGVRQPGLESWPCHFLYGFYDPDKLLPSLSLSFLISIMGMVMTCAPTTQGSSGGWMR